MKKVLFVLLSVLIGVNAWGACELTTYMLGNGSKADYDEYLYQDTKEYELRSEGKPGKAYLCYTGYCGAGTKKRLTSASVGGSVRNPDSVYVCENTGSANQSEGRTSFGWKTYNVQDTCTPKKVNGYSLDKEFNLYMVDGSYCKGVNPVKELKQDKDGNLLIVFVDGKSQKLNKNDAKKKNGFYEFASGVGKFIIRFTESATNPVVQIFDSTINGGAKLVEIAKDGTVKIVDIAGNMYNTTVKATGEVLVSLNNLLGKGVDAIKDVTVEVVDGVTQVTIKGMDTVEGVFQITKDGVVDLAKGTGKFALKIVDDGVQILNKAGDVVLGTIKTLTDGTVQLVQGVGKAAVEVYGVTVTATKEAFVSLNNLLGKGVDAIKDVTVEVVDGVTQVTIKGMDTVEGVFQITKDGVVDLAKGTGKFALKIVDDGVQILNKAGDVVLGTFKTLTDGTVQIVKVGGEVLRTISGDVAGVLKETLNVVNNFTDRAFGFVENIWTGFVDIFDFTDERQLAELKEQMEKCVTADQVVVLMQNFFAKVGLNETQLKQVQKLIEEKTDAKFAEINSKIVVMLNDIQQLKQQNNKLIADMKKVFANDKEMLKRIQSLEKEIETKVTAKQVLEMIDKAGLNARQDAQVRALIVEYTNQLSEGQRAEVQGMIQDYVNPLVSELKQDVADNAARDKSSDKVNSAMSVLNAFAAGEDASVWKNADGKFNTARLASDATAGVVLGTAGGLISNRLIKKNQIKKGFDGISCYVGGQIVADYGDEFTVGMQ